MSDDKMRAEFEKWAKEYMVSRDDIFAWQFWQAAYHAGRDAERAEVERLRAELAEAVKTLRRNGWGAE
jgi:hypothetical protein